MMDINIIDWEHQLDNCKYDKKVGIKIAKLTGDDHFSTYVTHIDAGKCVNPHYHKIGDEHYHIIEGLGTVSLKDMHTGLEKTFKINSGQSFVVPANTLHQLINTGKTPLILMFSCSKSHLDSDRFFT